MLMLHRYVFHTLFADVNVFHDPLSQPVSLETRKAKEVSIWEMEFGSLEEGFLCYIPRSIYQQDSYTELRLNTEQPATTDVINKTGKLLSLCQSADYPCTAPRDYPYPAHGPGLHVNPCSRLSAPAPVMLQQGQASAPHSLPCLATGPAKLDPSTDPHPAQSSAHHLPQERVQCLGWGCPSAPGCCGMCSDCHALCPLSV